MNPLLTLPRYRQHVTVSLSGDGGDELFCGYDMYRRMDRWQHAWRLPQAFRSALGQFGTFMGDERINLALRGLALPDAIAFADYYTGMWRPHEIDQLLSDSVTNSSSADGTGDLIASDSQRKLLDQLMLLDLHRYLPNDILTKVDRASMAVALETRVPLLDHRVVEFALRLPLELKWQQGISKYLLRQVLYRYVPPALIERPKQGFAVPLNPWLRDSLRGLITTYLNPNRLKKEGLFAPQPVQRQIERFLSGRSGHGRVWSLLVMQMWLERYWFTNTESSSA